MSDFGKFCELCEKNKSNPDFKCGYENGKETAKMQVAYEGKDYAVQVCTECEDEATPKKVREAISGRMDKYNDLIEKAKELGVELTLEALLAKNEGLVLATPAPVQPMVPAAPIQPTIQQHVQMAPQAVEERLLDEQGNRIRNQQIKSKEMQIVEANLHGSGRPIALPKKEIGNTGTTYYTVKRVTDKELQERFKKQAARSQGDESFHMQPCSSCGGNGHHVKVKGGRKVPEICAKCDGSGMVA